MSDYFKTPKGTELPFLNLKGKKYLQVMHRLVWFREEHKNASIETSFVKLEENYAIAKAVISFGNGETMAIAHGREDAKHFIDFIEKAETKAIGRALALCGYGTQFASELDEGERLADSPIPPKANVIKPPVMQNKPESTNDIDATPKVEPQKTSQGSTALNMDHEKLITTLNQTIAKKGIKKNEVIKLSESLFASGNVRNLSAEQLTQLTTMIGGTK